MPFNEFAEMYLEREGPLLKSIRTERNRVLAWAREFGSRPLGQIAGVEIEAWRRGKMTRCRPATINRDLSRLRRMFSLAVEWELLEESPMAGIRFLRENNARTRYLTLEESNRLIASCTSLRVRAIVTVALHSGMRLGEILNLHWSDLDSTAGVILVRDSKNGQRHVPMDATLTSLFRAYPRHHDSDLVFCNGAGGHLVDIRTGFKNACQRAGILGLHFHDLRHTAGSLFVMAGGDLYILKEILGHKSINMTQRYAHLSPAYKAKATDHLNNLWHTAKPEISAQERLPEPSSVTPVSQATYEDTPYRLNPVTTRV